MLSIRTGGPPLRNTLHRHLQDLTRLWPPPARLRAEQAIASDASYCPSDGEDWARCPHPSTRLRARHLLREEKRKTASGSLLIAAKRTRCSLLQSCCLEMDFRVLKSMPLALSTESPLACITGVPMLPTAFTGCVSLGRFVIFLSNKYFKRDQSFVQSNSLADVLLVAHGVLLESLSPQIGHD